jgi:PAS domain
MLRHSHPELKNARNVVFVDSSRQYVDCSDSAAHLLGYSPAEFLRRSIDDLSYWLDELPGRFEAYIRRGKQDGEYLLRQRNGGPLPIRYRSYIFADGCMAGEWEPITDWRVPYLAAISESEPGELRNRVDVALAAIYQRIYANKAIHPKADDEGTGICKALSVLSSLRARVGSALNPKLLAVEKTRSALLRLADKSQDTEATRVLLEENRVIIELVAREWFQPDLGDTILIVLIERIANKARYYDPEEDPVVWLHNYADLECKRLKNEMGWLLRQGNP